MSANWSTKKGLFLAADSNNDGRFWVTFDSDHGFKLMYPCKVKSLHIFDIRIWISCTLCSKRVGVVCSAPVIVLFQVKLEYQSSGRGSYGNI